MRKGKHELISGWLSITVFCLAIIALAVAIILHLKNDIPSLQNDGISSEESQIQKDPNSIAIPGYEILEFEAKKEMQTLCLSNPSQNGCYFQISLYLEENTLLWESELIEPGKTSKPILLNRALEKGTYTNAVLKYECFQMDGKTPLNGAETKLTLWVK